jgi:hypothetical protein
MKSQETTLPLTLDVNAAMDAVVAAEPEAMPSAVETFLRTVLNSVWICGPIARVVAWTGDAPAADNDYCLTEDGAFHGFFFDEDNHRFGFYLSETAGTWSVQFTAG